MTDRPIQAEFLKNARGDTFIRFFDPAYVRADLVLLDRENKSLYAVLHERDHLIATLDDDLFDTLICMDEIELDALMADGKDFKLKAPLTVTK